jgi:hypothetical protein
MGQYYHDGDVMRQRANTTLSDETIEQVHRIKVAGQKLFDEISLAQSSADLTLAKRKVEEAVMWAVKAVTA